MLLSSDLVYEPCGDYAFRTVAEEGVLVPVSAGVADMEHLFTFNEVGGVLWQLVVDRRSVGDMVAQVVEGWAVTREEAQRDVGEFLSALESEGLIRVTPGKGAGV